MTFATLCERAPAAICVSNVLGRAARTFVRHWLACCAIMALGWAPSVAAVWMATIGIAYSYALIAGAPYFALEAIDYIFTFFSVTSLLLTNAAIAYAAAQAGRGQGSPFGRSLGVALRRLPAIIAIEALIWLGAAAAALLFVVPGLIVLCLSAVAVPAGLVERLGPFTAIARSAFLTKGNRWRVFALLCPLYIGSIVLGRAVIGIAALAFGVLAALFVTLAYYVVIGAFNAVVSGALYVELRIAREGAEVEPIVEVFD